MTITLLPEQERLIATAMESGAYNTPEAVISRALERLHSEDEWLHGQKDEIEAKLKLSLEQFERGEGLSPEEARSEMERRKERWLAEQFTPDRLHHVETMTAIQKGIASAERGELKPAAQVLAEMQAKYGLSR